MIGKLFTDDGREVKRREIPVPGLCATCRKNDNREVACDLVSMDQAEEARNGGTFCCFAYEPKDPGVDRDAVIAEMERYLEAKGREGG